MIITAILLQIVQFEFLYLMGLLSCDESFSPLGHLVSPTLHVRFQLRQNTLVPPKERARWLAAFGSVQFCREEDIATRTQLLSL